MNAVVVQLKGGLGNQMFQYAMAYGRAIRSGLPLMLDVSRLNRDKLRGFELSIFDLSAEILPTYRSWLAKKGAESLTGYLKSMIGLANGKLPYVKEPHFHVSTDIQQATGPAFIDGYWQSEKYFNDVANEIKNQFQFAEPDNQRNRQFMAEVQNQNSVSVHVRRGDYATNPQTFKVHGLLDVEYYTRAIDFVHDKIMDARFYFFSDDPDWVQKTFAYIPDITVVDWNRNAPPAIDMQLMTACSNHIVANSSFSWWGAWLGRNENKIVAAPKNWFAIPPGNTNDLLPTHWNIVP